MWIDSEYHNLAKTGLLLLFTTMQIIVIILARRPATSALFLHKKMQSKCFS